MKYSIFAIAMNDFEVIFQIQKVNMVLRRIMNHVSLLQSSDFHFMRMYTQSTDITKAISTMLK